MNGKTPHLVQYQGSKRILAPQILQYMPHSINRLIEPFAGMAAITIAVAQRNMANNYLVNDLNEPIITLINEAVNAPNNLIEKYAILWREQFNYPEGHLQHFYKVRDEFNNGNQTAENMLYLLARCVKGSVRYGKNGKFNQSPDKRRHGTNPQNIKLNVNLISSILYGRTSFSALDYNEILDIARPGDLVYMDPPYQGVSNAKDNRYLTGLLFDEFSQSIEILNKKGIDFLISYDGECGGREYGNDLPKELECKKILLNAGFSSQSILLGKKETTLEALYISKGLQKYIKEIPNQISFFEEAI